jgi:hypothetical protein
LTSEVMEAVGGQKHPSEAKNGMKELIKSDLSYDLRGKSYYFEATDLYYLPNLTNIRECRYFCRYFCKYKKQLLYFLMTEGFQTFFSITILRTDISSSRTKPAGLDF